MESLSSSPIPTLPPEILITNIFPKLSKQEVAISGRVCKLWYMCSRHICPALGLYAITPTTIATLPKKGLRWSKICMNRDTVVCCLFRISRLSGKLLFNAFMYRHGDIINFTKESTPEHSSFYYDYVYSGDKKSFFHLSNRTFTMGLDWKNKLEVFDLENGKKLSEIPFNSEKNRIAVSSSNIIAKTIQDGVHRSIQLYDNDQLTSKMINIPIYSLGYCSGICFSGDKICVAYIFQHHETDLCCFSLQGKLLGRTLIKYGCKKLEGNEQFILFDTNESILIINPETLEIANTKEMYLKNSMSVLSGDKLIENEHGENITMTDLNDATQDIIPVDNYLLRVCNALDGFDDKNRNTFAVDGNYLVFKQPGSHFTGSHFIELWSLNKKRHLHTFEVQEEVQILAFKTETMINEKMPFSIFNFSLIAGLKNGELVVYRTSSEKMACANSTIQSSLEKLHDIKEKTIEKTKTIAESTLVIGFVGVAMLATIIRRRPCGIYFSPS